MTVTVQFTCMSGMSEFVEIDDPIDEAFPVAIEAARRFCRGRGDLDSLCLTYHSLWPRLRRIGRTGSIWLHSERYGAAFRSCARAGLNRILISGSADYSMLAHVLAAFHAEDVDPHIT